MFMGKYGMFMGFPHASQLFFGRKWFGTQNFQKNIRLAPKVRSALKSRSKSFAPGKVWLQATHEACKAANEVEALSLYPFSSKYTPLAGQPWQKDPVGHMVWHPRFLGQ